VPITNPYAVSTSAQTLILSADTAAAGDTLTFNSVPASIIVGMPVTDVTTAGAIATGVTVAATTDKTVTLSAKVAALVARGDAIQFTNANNGKPATDAGWFQGKLGDSILTAFSQSPGPSKIWAIPVEDTEQGVEDGLLVAAKLPVQIVVLADTPLTSAAGKSAVEALAQHCNNVSNNGPDGMERIGVAMLGSGETSTALVSSGMASNRMVMVAHHASDDAAAAVAGAIAGQEPHISMLLKPINVDMDTTFSDSEIDAFNTAGINWLTQTPLIPGAGFYLGEGYTLGRDQRYIDIVRTIDEISFDLKAALISSIGVLRVTRAGLRALAAEMSAVLQPLQDSGVIDSYLVFFPLLSLLDKDPSKLADVELQQIHNAQASRTVNSIATVEYAGAIHRLNITLKFE